MQRPYQSASASHHQELRGGSERRFCVIYYHLSLLLFLQQPRKALLEQLSRILPSDSDTLPDQLILANTCDRQGAHLAAKLVDYGHRVICTAGQADVRATLTCLVAKIQKFCNTKTQSPHLVKVMNMYICSKKKVFQRNCIGVIEPLQI